MNSQTLPITAYKEPPTPYWRWTSMGVLILIAAVAIFWLTETSSTEFWRAGISPAMFYILPSLVLCIPCYLLYALATGSITKQSQLSGHARRRWLLGVPFLTLIVVMVNLLNNQRTSVGFEAATGQNAPASLHNFHYVHGGFLMSVRKIAWFEASPEDVRQLVQMKELALTNGVSLHRLLNGDHEFVSADIPKLVPEMNYAVCYLSLWQKLNFSTQCYLFTTPEHDKAVWVYMHNR